MYKTLVGKGNNNLL